MILPFCHAADPTWGALLGPLCSLNCLDLSLPGLAVYCDCRLQMSALSARKPGLLVAAAEANSLQAQEHGRQASKQKFKAIVKATVAGLEYDRKTQWPGPVLAITSDCGAKNVKSAYLPNEGPQGGEHLRWLTSGS